MNKKLIFLVIGISLVVLAVGFVYGAIIWSDVVSIFFTIGYEGPRCLQKSLQWETPVGDGTYIYNYSFFDCYRPDGAPSTTCCPSTSRCKFVGPLISDYHCTGEPAPLYCENYEIEFDCRGFYSDVANRTMIRNADGDINICNSGRLIAEDPGPPSCSKLAVNCICEWDDTKGCSAQINTTSWVCENNPEVANVDTACNFQAISKEDNCTDTGWITYNLRALWYNSESTDRDDCASDTDCAEGFICKDEVDGTGKTCAPDWCKDGSKRVRCAAKLNFFTIASLIIAIVIIIIIYLIWIKKAKKVRRRKKKR